MEDDNKPNIQTDNKIGTANELPIERQVSPPNDQQFETPKPASTDKQQITCAFKSKPELYAAYMPFIKNGALFIPTNRAFNLGDEVYLALTLMEEPDKHIIRGKVIWTTPVGAQAGMRAGIGIQFMNEEAKEVRKKIETYLAGMMNSELRTDTL